MDAYKFDHRRRRHKIRYTLLVLFSIIVTLGGVAGFVTWVNSRHSRKPAIGATTLVPQQSNSQPTVRFDEPLYSFQLPSDWKRVDSQVHSVTWQATIKGADNRMLTIYTDDIPTSLPVNRELPLTVRSNQLIYGELSDNCANFTPGGTLDVGQAEKLKPAPSLWQGVNFICNLPQVVDNQIGTGSTAGVNTVAVTGPTQGTHNYFFLYTDRNVQPDYTILYGAIQSFRAQ